MKSVRHITDRAKRYRANATYAKRDHCDCTNRSHGHGGVCRSRRGLGVGHRDGDESNGKPSNLFTVCKSCNAKQAAEDKRRGRGVRTRQYNPQSRLTPAKAKTPFEREQFKIAVKTLNMPDEMVGVMGGMTKQQAAAIVAKYTPTPRGRHAHNPGYQSQVLQKGHWRVSVWASTDAGPWHVEPLIEGTYGGQIGKYKRKELALKKAQAFLDRMSAIKNPGATNLAQYVQAAVEHVRGTHDEGGRVIHETPKSKRREFAEEIWFRRGHNPHGLTRYYVGKPLDDGTGRYQEILVDKAENSETPTGKVYLHKAAALQAIVHKNARLKNPPADIMREWRAGTLRTSAGDLVPRGAKGEKMARAILLSELRREGRIPPRVNPSGMSADELYRKFHGVAPDNHLAFDVSLLDPYGSHPELAQFGLLVNLIVGEDIEVTPDSNGPPKIEALSEDAWNCSISFAPLAEYHRRFELLNGQASVDQLKSWLRSQGTPDVAGVPEGSNQIYIVGGNQNIDDRLPLLGVDPDKEVCDLGFCYWIEYMTQKRFDSMKPTEYYHCFGEKTRTMPRLIYWRKNHLLELVGGEYYYTARGIEN